MILYGERIKELFRSASTDVIVCAPFIKVDTLRVLLNVVDDSVKVFVCTRWRADEVAAGVSDLAVFDLLKDRENSDLRILDALHAKLFLADDRCLVGSANVTATALGWSKNPNVEIMIDAERLDQDIQELIRRINAAPVATFQMKAEVEKDAEKIQKPKLQEALDIEGEIAELSRPWLPQCAAPDKLYRVYSDPNTEAVAWGTRDDALSDLKALLPPDELTEEEFIHYIESTVSRLPAVRRIIDKIPGRLSDAEGAKLVADIKPGMSEEQARKQWAIFRDWIRVFFSNKIEVAPDSYVMRLKSSRR